MQATLIMALIAIGTSSQEDVVCKARLVNGEAYLVFTCRSVKPVYISTYRWHYSIDGFAADGELVTNEAGFLATTNLNLPVETDYVVLKGKGAKYILPVGLFNAKGIVRDTRRITELRVAASWPLFTGLPPLLTGEKAVPRAKILFRAWYKNESEKNVLQVKEEYHP